MGGSGHQRGVRSQGKWFLCSGQVSIRHSGTQGSGEGRGQTGGWGVVCGGEFKTETKAEHMLFHDRPTLLFLNILVFFSCFETNDIYFCSGLKSNTCSLWKTGKYRKV